MKAYDLAMALIFVNCSFPIIDLFGIDILHKYTGNFWLLSALTSPMFSIMGIPISGVSALAVFLAGLTIVVFGTTPMTDRGASMIVFTTIFWGSFGTASLSLFGIISEYPGLAVFWTIFLLASTLIFINALVQLSSGGQGGNV